MKGCISCKYPITLHFNILKPKVDFTSALKAEVLVYLSCLQQTMKSLHPLH